MDHTPWEDENSWWFDFVYDEHPDLVEAYRFPSDTDDGKTCLARGDLLDWLNQYDPSLWRYHASGRAMLTISTRDENFAFAFNLRWRGTPIRNQSN